MAAMLNGWKHSMLDLPCPCCGSINSLEAYLAGVAQGEAIAAALKAHPALAPALMSYMRLHNTPRRKPAISKTARLLVELCEMVSTNQVKRGHNSYQTTAELWRECMEEVVERARMPGSTLTLPLKGHGYLLSVIAGRCEQLAAKLEARKEANRSSGGDVIPAGMVVVNNPAQAQAPPSNKAAGRQHLAGLKTQMGIRPGGNES